MLHLKQNLSTSYSLLTLLLHTYYFIIIVWFTSHICVFDDSHLYFPVMSICSFVSKVFAPDMFLIIK